MFGLSDAVFVGAVGVPLVFAAAVMCGGLAAVGFRIPLPLWLLVPWSVALVGAVSTWRALYDSGRALANSDAGWRPAMAAASVTPALGGDGLGYAGAALAALLLATVAAPTAWRGAPDWQRSRAGGVAAGAVAAAIAVGALCVALELQPVPAVALGLAAVPLAAIAARPPESPLAADNRWTAAALVLVALGFGALATPSLERHETAIAWFPYTASLSTAGRLRLEPLAFAPGVSAALVGTALAAVALAGPGAAPTRWTSGGAGIGSLFLGVPVVLTALQQAPLDALVAAAGSGIGSPNSHTLESPEVPRVDPPDRTEPDLIAELHDVVAGGVRVHGATDRPDAAALARIRQHLMARSAPEPMVVQLHRTLPWSSVDPVLQVARDLGHRSFAIIAADRERFGVVLVDAGAAPEDPATTVEDFLRSLPE